MNCWKKVQFATNDESRVIGFQFARCPIDSSFGTIAKHRVAVAIKIRTPPPPPPPPSAPSSPRFRRLWFDGEGVSGMGTGTGTGGRWMRPPDQCSGGSGHDARRFQRGASRRWRAGSPRDAKRGCVKRSSLPVYSCGIPTRAAPFPDTIVRILMPSAPCRYPRRGQKHPRTTVELCAFELTRWERKRSEGEAEARGEIESEACISENWRYPVQSALAIRRPESRVSILIVISGTYAAGCNIPAFLLLTF